MKKIWLTIRDILVGVGALNWGLTLFKFNLVEFITSFTHRLVTPITYAVVGVSGAWFLYEKLNIKKLFK